MLLLAVGGVGKNVGAFGLSCCLAAIPAATCAATWVASACGDKRVDGACGGDGGGGVFFRPAPRRRSERRGIIVVGTLGPSTSASNVIIVAV